MEKIIRTGVIGTGGISSVHIPALMHMENVKIQAVCDINKERMQKAAETTGADMEDDWHALLSRDDIDAVHILTPHYLHAPMALEALEKGKHVLTEKPMATTVEDAMRMVEASEKPGSPLLGVIFQNRFNPASVALKAIVQGGEYGAFICARANVSWHREAPYYTESGWRGTWKTEGGGSLINQAIHTLDLMSYVCGRIARVKGHISTDMLEGVIEVEDNCHAVIEYASGARGILQTTNNYLTDAPVMLEVVLEKGTFQIVGDKLYRVDGGEYRMLESGAAPSNSKKSYWGASHGLQIADFYESVRTGKPLAVTARSAFPALNLVKAIHESSRENRWVDLIDMTK